MRSVAEGLKKMEEHSSTPWETRGDGALAISPTSTPIEQIPDRASRDNKSTLTFRTRSTNLRETALRPCRRSINVYAVVCTLCPQVSSRYRDRQRSRRLPHVAKRRTYVTLGI